MDDKRSSAVWIVAAMLLALPVLYVASYLAIVEPDISAAAVSDSPHYPYGGHYSETIFWPLEQLDRRIRPGQWDDETFIGPIFVKPTEIIPRRIGN